MASLDKVSVRSEVERLKVDFENLHRDGKISVEMEAIMNSMFMIVELILSIFLERTTKKNSRNSSIPPSQTGKDDSSPSSSKPSGKGKEENDAVAGNTRTVESTRVAAVDFCDKCGESLKGVSSDGHERRTKIDIVFEKVVEHVDAEVKHCPSCQSTVKGSFPSDMHGPLQYGNGLKAFVIDLLVGQMLSLSRAQNLLKSIMGRIISEATLLSFILRLYDALEDWERHATAELLRMPCIHVDETSQRVDKKNHWMHVYSCKDITLKFLHRKRGKKAIEAIDIIPRYGGVIIHDCWASYLSYKHCGHGLCGSHLLRELTFVVDANGYAWADDMKRLLQDACKTVSEREEKCLTEEEFESLQEQYRNILDCGEKELPPVLPKPNGKRGKMAKSDAHNLWERLKKHEAAVLLFAKETQVSFTNNRAERDLRMGKVKQKVSGCFRVELYAKAYARISSYLQTMANKGYNPLIAIQMALAGDAHA